MNITDVYINYNPYRLRTTFKINGKTIEQGILQKANADNGKRLQEWIYMLPQWLSDQENCDHFKITFHGSKLDFEDVKESFMLAEKKGIHSECVLEEAHDEGDIYNGIIKIFQDLQSGPISELKTEKLRNQFENVCNALFPIQVVATMSSGKSTLINAMLQKKLMPSKNEACTAIITEIIDNDNEIFDAIAYNSKNKIVGKSDNLTYEQMKQFNSQQENPENNVCLVKINGDIPFIDANTIRLELVDTPGPNNSNDKSHQETTYRNLSSQANNMVLYVLNYTQLGTNDDETLLEYVSKQIAEGGKQAHDRFIFVINKMDEVKEEDHIEEAIQKVKAYLERHNIKEPQIYLASSISALGICTLLKNLDGKKLYDDSFSRSEKAELSPDTKDAMNLMYKLVDNKNLHLEEYVKHTLTPSEQAKIDKRLEEAIENQDIRSEALIHSGIPSIEAAIKAYVKKYARTKQIRDLVDTFESMLVQEGIIARISSEIAESEKVYEEFLKKKAAIEKFISNGDAARSFKKQIDAVDVSDIIKEKTRNAMKDIDKKLDKLQNNLKGKNELTEQEATEYIEKFNKSANKIVSEFAVNMEKIVNENIVALGNQLIDEYTKRLAKFDVDSGVNLSFSTADLVKGMINEIRGNLNTFSRNFEVIQSESLNTVAEEKTYIETETFEVEKTRKVFDHTEKYDTGLTKTVNYGKVKSGTVAKERKIDNSQKKKDVFLDSVKFGACFALIGAIPGAIVGGIRSAITPKEIIETYEEDVYVDDIRIEKVFEDKAVYRDEKYTDFEERKVTKTKTVYTQKKINIHLLSKIHPLLDASVNKTQEDSKKIINQLKDEFSKSFDKIDKCILEKQNEMAKIKNDTEESKKMIEINKRKAEWLAANRKELDDLLNV